MPILHCDDRGVAEAIDLLRSGAPIVLPTPSPFAYVIGATDAATVNRAKKRPADQSVGVGVADLDVLAAHLDVDEDVVALARWLSESESVSLLIPIRGDAPGWLGPATSDGMVFFSAAPWLSEVRSIITAFDHLYVTSANITGEPPATTAARAYETFGESLPVLDCDALRDPLLEHGSTTILRVSGAGELSVARPGINDRRFGAGPAAYAQELSRRWKAAR
jgi:tRNA A37 threonylcarbamoyladenosine synthetase subunit TsaC/SUA5/YrdC